MYQSSTAMSVKIDARARRITCEAAAFSLKPAWNVNKAIYKNSQASIRKLQLLPVIERKYKFSSEFLVNIQYTAENENISRVEHCYAD